MAKSLAHSWGQIVGDLFESAFNDLLVSAATNAGVFIDYNGMTRANDCGVRNKHGKLAWPDGDGNWHQLDFVYERGGTTDKVGVPLAFVEVAWRRYTKHSKNKAQEIEGAIIPIADTHRHSHPFLGAIIGGFFTKNAVEQLQSRGFILINVPYENVVAALASAGIDASYGENTEEAEYETKIAAFSKLTAAQKRSVQSAIVASVPDQTTEFIKNLSASIGRQVARILVVPLHGEGKEWNAGQTVADAIAFVAAYQESPGTHGDFLRYEIHVRFSNKAELRGEFPTKYEALAFLRTLE